MTFTPLPGTVEWDQGWRIVQLVSAYTAALAQGYEHGGRDFQLDLRSAGRMSIVLAELRAGIANPHGGFWIDRENNPLEMEDTEAQTFLAAAGARSLEIDQTYFSTRTAILAATTTEEGESVPIDFGD